MTSTTISTQQFNDDVTGATCAAEKGPVIITDQGQPIFVLLRYEDWQHQAGSIPGLSLLDALADPAGAAIEFEP